MSLHTWDWEDEDRDTLGPMPSMGSFCRSLSEYDMEEYLKVRAQTHHSSSIMSSDGPASTFSSDVPEVVPCKFIVSLAFPVIVGHKGKYSNLTEKYRRHHKTDKPAKSHLFYHVEYFLLPDDKEPKKVDMVVFPTQVKVFLDSGIKTVRPWQEEDKVWVSWSQSFNINMTKELLKKINFYKITLRLWDTTDKVSKKVKYYRFKTATYAEDKGSLEEVKHLVLNQRKLSEQSIHLREDWNQDYDPENPEKEEKQLKSLHVKWKETEREKENQKRRKKYSEGDKTDPKLADRWKHGVFSIQLTLMPLLAGWQTVVSRGSKKSANILDCLLTFNTEVPIMTEEQKQDLNPLIIKIKCVSCLPSQPVPIHELERLCIPVYCKYQFHKTPIHQTEGKPHGSHISFEDINVIFLGAMHPRDLREYLEGPPMVVEVHDRDRKSEEYSQKPTLFGEDPLDSYLNFQALISPKETEDNPFESQNKMWDPYGVARVSFADLLLGHKYLNLAVPIHNCESKPIHHGHGSRSRKIVGFRVPKDVLLHAPMPMGNYLEANSVLKLRVDITVPLRATAEAPDPGLMGTQFGRIIFVFESWKFSFLYDLLQDITMINAKTLELESYSIENIQQILSTFKMRVKIQDRQDLDVLTGFHLLDGRIHVLVLEGLADQGLRRLWESHQSRITKSEPGKYKVLYNSQLLFQRRLYGDLETMLYHVHLCKPLSQLMKHVTLYLRDTLLQNAFQALTRIYCICRYSTKLKEVITEDLLPSSAMIKDLSQELGLPISQEELTNIKLLVIPPPPTFNFEGPRCPNSTLSYKILAHQKKYLQWRKSVMQKKKGQKHSLIQKNITGAYQVSKKPPKSVVEVIRSSPPTKDAVYNYSIQTLNSTELAKKELYREMAKVPGRRFTYSQNYLSAMVEPQDSKEEEKEAKKKSRLAWLTVNGFQVTGLHKSTESDHHLELLPTGTTTELAEEWRENALFANVLEPVLDRERWSWDRRHQDFDLYKKPPPFFRLPASPSLNPGIGNRQEDRRE